MRKKLKLLSLLLIISHFSTAQVKYGPEIGLNMGHYTLDNGLLAVGSSLEPGIIIGGVCELPFSKHFSLQPAARFMTAGYRLDDALFTLDATINSIQVPVNILYRPGNEEHHKFYISAGPYFAVNIVAREKVTTSGLFGASQVIDSVHNLSAGDAGVGINVGYNFSKHFLLQCHFQRSYGYLFFDSRGVEVKNYNLGFTIGYLFGKEKEKTVKRKPVKRPPPYRPPVKKL